MALAMGTACTTHKKTPGHCPGVTFPSAADRRSATRRANQED